MNFLPGKLCLQHEDLAKKCIPALARELEVSNEVAIRNNVIIVICDLCVRYTTMVDRYIPNVSVCLRDPEPFIRRQTLIMLTNLLQVSNPPKLCVYIIYERETLSTIIAVIHYSTFSLNSAGAYLRLIVRGYFFFLK